MFIPVKKHGPIFDPFVKFKKQCPQLVHCKKTYRQIPISEPDYARPNNQADGVCLRQTCRTFPTSSNTLVELFRHFPVPKLDFSHIFQLLSRTFPTCSTTAVRLFPHIPITKMDFSDIQYFNTQVSHFQHDKNKTTSSPYYFLLT
jgi:hypothetical protein